MISASIDGAEKNQMVVVGDGVDSVTLTTLLRKRMGFAELVSVITLQEKKAEEYKQAQSTPVVAWPSYGGGYPTQYYYPVNSVEERYPDSSCCIM